MEINEKLNLVLNDLIRLNHDREEGYANAIKQLGLNNNGLKKMFRNYEKDSSQFAETLSMYVARNGGKPSTEATVSGKIYRAWMDIKAAMTNKESESILESCEYVEEATQKVYHHALRADVSMPADIRCVIMRQKFLLEKAHDAIKFKRNSQVVQH
ncbi:MAG: PA2169 family four-helix-bundle protein [Chitinophagaceae bacterium]